MTSRVWIWGRVVGMEDMVRLRSAEARCQGDEGNIALLVRHKRIEHAE